MKPNLFRSVSNAIAAEFPLLPYVRRSFFGLILFAAIFILIGYTGDHQLTVAVEPVKTGALFNKTIQAYGSNTVVVAGQIKIADPTLLQKSLLPDTKSNLDLFTLVLIIIISIVIIRILPKIHDQHLFRKDISNSIRLLGYLLLLHAIISLYRTFMYAPAEIQEMTGGEFTTATTFPVLICAEIYTSLLVVAIGSLYQRGIQLQKEQDLTI